MGTLDDNQKNRGLRFDVEMTPFCGREAAVLRKAEKFIDDRSGRMISPRGTCLILDEVACHGNLSTGRLFCPRNIYAYWHEVWLEPPGRPGGVRLAGAVRQWRSGRRKRPDPSTNET